MSARVVVLGDIMCDVVAVQDGHGLLDQDRAVIEVFVHEVHRAAGNFHAIIEGLLLRFQPGKRR